MNFPRLFVLAMLLAASRLWGDEPTAPPAPLVGHWTGQAKVVDDGYQRISFRVDLEIRRDGTVVGKVGEATLVNAHFDRHRPKNLSRRQSAMMDYMIHCDISGPLVAKEEFIAKEVFIPIDFEGGKLDSAVHSHDSQIHGKAMGIVTADVVLTKKKD